jgi:DNA repair exonuclease SbcCD ATPase subunit
LIKSAQPKPKELPIELVPSILRADIQRLDKKIRENEKEFKDSVGKISEEELNTLKKNQIIQLNKSVSELNKLVELKAKCSKLIEKTQKSLDRVKDKPQSIENLDATKELDVELRKLRKELKGHNNREIELKELVQKLEKSVQSTQEKLIDVDYYKNKIKKLRYDMDILTALLEKASKLNPKVVSFVKNLKLKKENSWSTRGQTLFIEQNGITISYRKDELARNGVLLQDVISYLSTQNT